MDAGKWIALIFGVPFIVINLVMFGFVYPNGIDADAHKWVKQGNEMSAEKLIELFKDKI